MGTHLFPSLQKAKTLRVWEITWGQTSVTAREKRIDPCPWPLLELAAQHLSAGRNLRARDRIAVLLARFQKAVGHGVTATTRCSPASR